MLEPIVKNPIYRFFRFNNKCGARRQAIPSEESEKLDALVTRRKQLLDLINQESNRLKQAYDAEVKELIRESLKHLKNQLKTLGKRIEKAVIPSVSWSSPELPSASASKLMLPQNHQAVNQFIEHRSYALRKPRGFGGWPPITLDEQNRSLEILYFQTELDKLLDRC